MTDIDYIMGLLDWNGPASDQALGINLAEKVQNINAFLQPCSERYNKNVWENCALVLASRTDEELAPYLGELMLWLRDMNWPGAFCILRRLCRFADRQYLTNVLERCMRCTSALDDTVWLENLRVLERTESFAAKQ